MQGDQIQNTKGILSVLELVIVVGHRSWKNDERVMENHGKIMEFDAGKLLGTLLKSEHLQPQNMYALEQS